MRLHIADARRVPATRGWLPCLWSVDSFSGNGESLAAQRGVPESRRASGTLHRLEGVVLLLMRFSLAAVFAPAGWGKLHHISKVAGFFSQLGIPWPHASAALVGGCEFVCGVLLAVGALARLATIPLIVIMAVAIATARWHAVGGVIDFFALDEFVYIAMLLAILVEGAGWISLDNLTRTLSGRPAEVRHPPRPTEPQPA
jgi:putative oxidoreductase